MVRSAKFLEYCRNVWLRKCALQPAHTGIFWLSDTPIHHGYLSPSKCYQLPELLRWLQLPEPESILCNPN